MNFPKRTQEIATILCHPHLLDGDIELSRKIVNLLKEAETDCSRVWHTHRYHDLLGRSGLDSLPHEAGYVFIQFYHRFIPFLKEVLCDLKEDSYPPLGKGNQHWSYIIELWNEAAAEQLTLQRSPAFLK